MLILAMIGDVEHNSVPYAEHKSVETIRRVICRDVIILFAGGGMFYRRFRERTKELYSSWVDKLQQKKSF